MQYNFYLARVCFFIYLAKPEMTEMHYCFLQYLL
uniref:Uncharacterized protein n=1 Tax=Anguilla anguilla TaxID=7936 RepID=A0A0E9PD13_ANGAN